MNRLTLLIVALFIAVGNLCSQSLQPKTPAIEDFLPYTDDIGFGTIKFCLYSETADDGLPLPSDNMFFNLLLDEEPLTFTTDVYSDLDADMTDVPYDFEAFPKISVWGDKRTVFFYTSDYKKMGVRSIYVDGDGKRHESQTAWINADGTTDGVSPITCAPVSESAYGYDILGRSGASTLGGLHLSKAKKGNGESVWIKHWR